MRLMCAIVSRKLAAKASGEILPAWVSRHVSQCDSCAAEASMYEAVNAAIRESVCPAERTSLTWEELRATLPVSRPQRHTPVFAFAGAAAAVVAAVILAASMLPRGTATRYDVTKRSQPAIERVQKGSPNSEQVAYKAPSDHTNAQVVTKGDSAKPTKAVRRPAPQRTQVHYKKRPAPAKIVPEPSVDNGPTVTAANDEPEAPKYRVVGAEEHVIDVVGTHVSATDTPDTNYVIRQTDTGDERPAVLL